MFTAETVEFIRPNKEDEKMALLDEQGVRHALDICGASDEQIDSIVDKGVEEMADLLLLDDKEIGRMMTNITRLPANRGGTRIGAVVTKKVKALAYWCMEQERQDKDLDANRFTDAELLATLQ
jgi:hypothetical protein